MKLINPNEIGVKVSTLIIESKLFFTAVSPYLDISNWKKILINIEKAINRGVNISFYYREIKAQDFKTLKGLGVNLYEITGLHTKIYFNETKVIVSSMNLYEYSDLHSIDIAIQFSDSKNYHKISEYFINYIASCSSQKEINSNSLVLNLTELQDCLINHFPNNEINLGNDYIFSSDLNKYFHLFIEKNNISFKYPEKNISKLNIKKIDKKLTNIFGNNIKYKPYNTTSETKYSLWEVEINNYLLSSYINIIKKLNKFN